MRRALAILALAGLLGCTAAGWSDSEAPALRRVLFTAEDTPGRQGLLYTAMVEAEAAAQAAGLGIAVADNPLEAKGAVGEVLYAVEPERAPDWTAKRSGIVQGWRAKGYGVLRAVDEMSEELRRLGRGEGEAPERALVCLDNTRRWAQEIVRLAERALEIDDVERLEPVLRQIAELAPQLSEGRDADGDDEIGLESGECALQQVQALLQPLRHRVRPT